MKKFTEIEQFRNVIKEIRLNHDYKGKDENDNPIYSHMTAYPTLKFNGTVKLHGTNAGIVKYKNDEYEFQSRERILSLTSDNAGFMLNMLKTDYKDLFNGIEFNEYCAIYGEWCGSGIQKSVAISQLPKMFVIFAVKIDGVYQSMENFNHLKNEEQRIFNITQFPSFSMEIDFNSPELTQNKLIDITMEVEKECPIGKHFGVSGIGEGVVWEYINGDKRYIFKVKGEKHQSSKITKLVTVNVEEIENLKKFIDYSVTESRLLQGIDKMKELSIPLEMKSTADYLRWIYNDIVKEEMDTIVENGIDVKKIGSAISNKARPFWMNYLNSNI